MPSPLLQENHFAILGKDQIHYQRISPKGPFDIESPTIVFLHDALGSVAQWRDFPAKLSQASHCQALVFDRLGYGKSSPTQEKRDKNYLHREAWERLPTLLKTIGLKKIILFGLSDGASIALLFAARKFPGVQVLGVVSEAAHVFVEDITLAGIQNTIAQAKQTRLEEKLAKFHDAQAKYLIAAWSKTWTEKSFRDWNMEASLQDISAPVLILQGTNDEYGSPAQVKAIASQVVGPSFPCMIEDCGHFPHFEAEAKVLKESKSFIEGVLQKQNTLSATN